LSVLYDQSEGQWLRLICSSNNWHLWSFYFGWQGVDRMGWPYQAIGHRDVRV